MKKIGEINPVRNIKKIKFSIIIISGVILVMIIASAYLLIQKQRQNKVALVARVIDGDTFQLENGNRVRLICVDAPNVGDIGYYEAQDYLEYLVLDKIVKLEKDVSDTDKYQRLLRYVYAKTEAEKEIFVNQEIVKSGHAVVYPVGQDTSKCVEISEGDEGVGAD